MADTIIIPDCGKIALLQNMLGKDTPEDLTVELFTADPSAGDATVWGDLTLMTGKHSYTAKTLTMSVWDVPTCPGGEDYSKSQYNAGTAVTWTFTNDGVSGSVSVYGYAVKMATTRTLLWVCEFEAAKPIQYTNETISIIPELRFSLAT